MSPKEVLYIEDALAHMKFMKEKCAHASQTVKCAELKQLLDRVATKNQMMFDEVYGVLSSH